MFRNRFAAIVFVSSLLFVGAVHSANFSWLFNGSTTEGWTVNNMQGYTVSGSYLKLNPGTDPQLISPSLNVAPSGLNYMKIGIRNNGSDTRGEVFYKTSALAFDQNRRGLFTDYNDGAWHILSVRLDNIPSWNGPNPIQQIRVDPVVNSAGGNDSVLIDFIFFRLDQQNPYSPAITSVSPSTWTNGPITVEFESNDPSDNPVGGPDDYGSGVDYFRYRVDPQPDANVYPTWADMWSGRSVSSVTYQPGQLAAGANYFHVYCADKTQHYSTDTKTWLYYDPNPPSVPTGVIASPSSSYSNSFSFSWGPSSDFGLSGVAGYYWSINDGDENWVPAGVTSTGTIQDAAVEGLNTFSVRAEDAVGNSSDYGEVQFSYFVPRIAMSADSLAFLVTSSGSIPATQKISISNGGTGDLSWSASANSDWLQFTPTSAANNLQDMTFSVTTTNKPTGTYVSNITINSTIAANSPQVITAVLFVVPDTYPQLLFDSSDMEYLPGQTISISGKSVHLNGSPYQPPSGRLTVEDPIRGIVDSISVSTDGSFLFQGPSTGAVDGLYMYVFAFDYGTGKALQAFNVPVIAQQSPREASAFGDTYLMSRSYGLKSGPLVSPLPKATDMFSKRKSNSAIPVISQSLRDGLKAMYGAMVADITAGWKRTTSNNSIYQFGKVQLKRCSIFNRNACWTGVGAMVATGYQLPWNTLVAKVDQGVDLLHQAGVLNECAYQGAKSGVEVGDLIVGIVSVKDGNVFDWVSGIQQGASFGALLQTIDSRLGVCLNGKSTPSVGAIFSMPGTDAVMMGLFPRYKKVAVVKGHSPIEITVVDPLGRIISRTENQIPGGAYLEFDMNLEGDSEQVVIIPMDSAVGDLSIGIVPKPGASVNDTFSVIVDYTYFQKSDTIAFEKQISEIPVEPWTIHTFENHSPVAFELSTMDDTSFTDYPLTLMWHSSQDPDPGQIVSYSLILSQSSDLSDSVVLDCGQDTTRLISSLLAGFNKTLPLTRYYWTAVAHDDWGAQFRCSIRTFRVGSCCFNTTGNVDCDPYDYTDISDLTALIDHLYISFSPLCCPPEANADGQPGIDISDLTALIDYLYISFTPPATCQ